MTQRTKTRSAEEAVSYAIGHRIRIEILALLNEDSYSPDQLARMVRQPLSKVSHHVKELRDAGAIEVTKTKKVRNVHQNFYRAVEIPFFSEEEMAAKSPAERREIYGLVLQASMAETLASFWAGKITEDPLAWLSWCWLNLDRRGREELADELEASRQRIIDIETRATSRRAKSGENAVSTIVTLYAHERSRAAARTLRDR